MIVVEAVARSSSPIINESDPVLAAQSHSLGASSLPLSGFGITTDE
jgi:hypothetical protein